MGRNLLRNDRPSETYTGKDQLDSAPPPVPRLGASSLPLMVRLIKHRRMIVEVSVHGFFKKMNVNFKWKNGAHSKGSFIRALNDCCMSNCGYWSEHRLHQMSLTKHETTNQRRRVLVGMCQQFRTLHALTNNQPLRVHAFVWRPRGTTTFRICNESTKKGCIFVQRRWRRPMPGVSFA